jgi:hypothetical protein
MRVPRPLRLRFLRTGHLATLPSSFGAGYANIPAGYRFRISLNSDFLGNITGVTFSMYDQNGAAVFPPQPIPLTTLTDVNGNQVTAADLSPIVDIQVVVGVTPTAPIPVLSGARAWSPTMPITL